MHTNWNADVAATKHDFKIDEHTFSVYLKKKWQETREYFMCLTLSKLRYFITFPFTLKCNSHLKVNENYFILQNTSNQVVGMLGF